MRSDNPNIRHIMALVLHRLDNSEPFAYNKEMLIQGLEDIKDMEEKNKMLNGLYKQVKYFYDKGDVSDLLHSRFFKPGHESCSEGSCFDSENDPCE